MKKILFLCALGLLLTGCSKKEKAPAAAPAPEATPAPAAANAPAAAPAPIAEPDMSKTTERLTQAVRKFSAETRSVPKSLNELVTMGYLPEVPEAPPGKKFVIDDKLRVVVK